MTNSKIKLIAILMFPIVIQSAAITDWNQKLLEAAQIGNLDQVKEALSNGAAIDARDNEQRTPLHYAAINGRTEIVNTLIKEAATIDARNHDQWTPLHYAANNGRTEVVNALILAKATIDARNNVQWTPLHYAARGGRTEVVNALISAKATIDTKNNNQWTPLHYVAHNGRTEIVNALVSAKAIIDARDNDQSTPLHLAAMNGRTEIVKVLLDVGSNSTLLFKDNKTIFSLITESWVIKPNEKEQLTKIIKDHQAYQEFMLKEVPKLFVEQRDQFNIPEPIANLITQYAFGICAADQNKKGDNNDKL